MNYPKLNFSFKSVDIESPIPELKVGDDFRYSGTYSEGYEEGVSKIVNFYKTLPLLDGVEYVSEIKHLNKYSVMMKLENSKVILLGFITPDGFEVSEDAARDYWFEKFKIERYSEEEVKELLNKRSFDLIHKRDIKTTNEWFDKYKKK